MELNSNLLRARQKDFGVKLFYSLTREIREKRENVVDIGSDIEVDFSEKKKIESVIKKAHTISLKEDEYIKYSSSWGTFALRKALVDFFGLRGVDYLSCEDNVMVTRGILDSFQKVLFSLSIDTVIIPSYAPYFATTFSLANGKDVIFADSDLENGTFDLEKLLANIKKHKKRKRILMYLVHPCAPTGAVMPDSFIENKLIPFLKKNNIILFVDSYIFSTTFNEVEIRPILSYKDSIDVTVEAITLSKEIGLPGVRSGGIVGNSKVIEAVRILGAVNIDMIPLFAQRVGSLALKEIDPYSSAKRVIEELKNEIIPGLERLKWPFIQPKAGFDMLIRVPPSFLKHDVEDPALYACFSILRKFGVAFFPYQANGDLPREEKFFLRIVLKQKKGKIKNALNFMAESGFCWETYVPSQEDVFFLKEKISTLDLTKL